jgi:hypothetical protein
LFLGEKFGANIVAKKIKPLINAEEAQAIAEQADPKNVNGRLYDAMSTLLDSFHDMNVREQVATIAAIARIQVAFIKLRDESYGSGAIYSGTAVKRYEKAFAANAARRRHVGTRNGDVPLLETLDDDELEY